MTSKYMTFDESGHIKERLILGICDIPEGAIGISEELWLQSATDLTGQWRLIDGTLTKVPFELKVDFAHLIAAERFRRETAGVEVDGLYIETTRDSQALIASAGLSAIIETQYRCNFKTLDGFVDIDAAQILAIAKGVRAHVQACFDRELTLLHAVEAGNFASTMLEEGWPASLPAELLLRT